MGCCRVDSAEWIERPPVIHVVVTGHSPEMPDGSCEVPIEWQASFVSRILTTLPGALQLDIRCYLQPVIESGEPTSPESGEAPRATREIVTP